MSDRLNQLHIKSLDAMWDAIRPRKHYSSDFYRFLQKLKFNKENKNLALLNLKHKDPLIQYYCNKVLKSSAIKNPNKV